MTIYINMNDGDSDAMDKPGPEWNIVTRSSIVVVPPILSNGPAAWALTHASKTVHAWLS